MNVKVVLGAFVLAVLIVCGAYVGSHWAYREVEDVKVVDGQSPAASAPGSEATAPYAVAKSPEVLAESPEAMVDLGAKQADTDNLPDSSEYPKTVQTSSNPLFAEGVPEHLQCPQEWIGVYSQGLSVEDLLKIKAIADEVVAKYNPNRPLADVWPQFIESEKFYHANAEPGKAGLGTAANRIDWGVQSILDFPEILVLQEEDPDRSFDMWKVDKGDWDPDWNLHSLPDGREFRTAAGYWYEFSYGSGNEDRYSGNVLGVGHSGRDAERISINLNETSDEELEQLGGWNYNINPYTTGESDK